MHQLNHSKAAAAAMAAAAAKEAIERPLHCWPIWNHHHACTLR